MKSTAFRFLDLLPELRNRIYRLCLVKDEPIYLQSYTDRADERTVLALLEVSKQVRNEGFGIYHESNSFRFRDGTHGWIEDGMSSVGTFVRSVSRRGLLYVKTITFESEAIKTFGWDLKRLPHPNRCSTCLDLCVVRSGACLPHRESTTRRRMLR